MATDEKPEFTVVDKRRTAEGSEEPAEGQPEASLPDAVETQVHDPSGDDATPDEAAGEEPQLPALTMLDRMLMCIDILGQGAWIAMGLVTDPATGEIKKDMAACQKAIDAVAFLADKVDADLDEGVRRELRNLVSNLRVNFVQHLDR